MRKTNTAKIANYKGYNFFLINQEGEILYNVVPENQENPNTGYLSSEYICRIKKVPNLFLTNNI
jgi:hypothetical protein